MWFLSSVIMKSTKWKPPYTPSDVPALMKCYFWSYPTFHCITSFFMMGISVEIGRNIVEKFKSKIVEADTEQNWYFFFLFYCSLWSWCLPIYPIWKNSRRPILCWRCSKKTISLYDLSLCLLFQTCYGPTRLQPTYQMYQWTSSS